MKAVFDVLCSSGEACPLVMDVLKKMKFHDVKDTPSSSTSDITAIIEINNEKEVETIAKQLFEKTEDNIEQITIRTS